MKRFFCFIVLSSIALSNLTPQGTGERLRERIYVQTDKHLYLAGEPVLMNFLTTDPEQIPLAFSKVAYIELVSDSIARVQTKVELTDGKGAGRMLLPTDLPTGYYRLIAYTQYMRNEGVDVFFEKNIAVVNTFQSGYQLAEAPLPASPSESKGDGAGAVSLQPDKATYTTRVHGELFINGLPKNIHTLSVSIAGKELVPVETDISLIKKNQTNKSTRFTGIFLPEYEGHIVMGQIVDNQSVPVSANSPKARLQVNETPVTDPEKLNLIANITNQLKDLDSLLKVLQLKDDNYTRSIVANLEKMVANEQKKIDEISTVSELISESNTDISIMNVAGLSFPSVEGIRFFPGLKSTADVVQFITTGISGTKEIATVVYHAGDKYRVDIISPFVNRYAPKPMPALHIDSANYRQLLARSVALQVFRYFSEDPSENQIVPESHFKMKPTYSYLLDEYTRFSTMREIFIEFVTGARFRRRDGKQELSVLTKRGSYNDYGPMPLVLLDGVPISNHDAIYNYDPLTVEKINIYFGPCMLGGFQFDGIVELLTYRRIHQDLNLSRSSQVLTYEAPQLPYRMDHPDYSKEKNRQSRMPDGRHTLLWNSDVQTDGKTSIRLPFDTSDLTGEFQATVEGVTKNGEFFFATSVFEVN